MAIVITGINGMIGSEIAKCCRKAGYIVIGIGRQPYEKNQISNYYFQIDISKWSNFYELVGNGIEVDCIIHCAASINGDGKDLIKVNVIGTKNVYRLANEKKCKKVIYCSSLPVIGIPKIIPISEQHKTHPCTFYHKTKLWGEKIIKKLSCEYFILRFCSPISSSGDRRRIFPTLVDNCLANEKIILRGNYNRIQNYIAVSDIAQACMELVQNSANSGIYNLSGESISNYDLAVACKRKLNSESEIIIASNMKKNLVEEWIIDDSKAYYEFGFKHQNTIDNMIELLKEK